MKTLDEHNADRKDPRFPGVLCPRCPRAEMHFAILGAGSTHGRSGRFVICPRCGHFGEMIEASPSKEAKTGTT